MFGSCQVWCTCVPVGSGLVGTETEKQGFLGTLVWTRKWGDVCVCTWDGCVCMELMCASKHVEVCVITYEDMLAWHPM